MACLRRLLCCCWCCWCCRCRRLGASFAADGDVDFLDDVAFGVLTCDRYIETRLRAQERTWLRDVRPRTALAFSDAAPTTRREEGAVEVVVDRTHPEPSEELRDNGAWRALSMVEMLHARSPKAEWYFFVDDDTYVYVSNLVRELKKLDAAGDHYVGWTYQVGPNQKGLFPGEAFPRVNIGGAGFGISRGLMTKLAPRIPACRRKYTWNWQGDMRIAKCIDDLGYEAEDDSHFYADNVSMSLIFGHGHLKGLPPVSFHHLSPEEMYSLRAAQIVPVGNQAQTQSKADFSEYMLRELGFYDAYSNQTFRMRFGKEVNISEGVVVAETAINRPSARADKLAAFAQAPPGSTHRFEQKYRGRCDAAALRPGSELTVRAFISCGSCTEVIRPAEATPNAADGAPAICRTETLDTCSHDLHIALHCPPMTLVAPEGSRLLRGAGS